ncbi:MAG: MATE family efflux transporter [Bacteroidota bacterium]
MLNKIIDNLVPAILGKEKEFTKGSIRRAIFMLSVPMILEMIMESLFAVVDIYFVGQISTDAVATVGVTESVITLVYAMAIGISMAATAMVGRRIGENDREGAAVAAVQAIILGIGVSIVLGTLGFLYAEEMLRLMGLNEQLIAENASYTRIIFSTNIAITLLFLLNAVFRGAGDASLAMWALWIANGLNMILDPLFIFGYGPFPEMGIAGAAIATSIGRGVGVAFQLFILFRGMSIIRIMRRHLKIQWNIIKRLFEVSLGGAGQHVIASASWIFLMRIIAIFGEDVLAGYTIAIRVIIFCILPSWGMSNATATLVGQNLGAKQPERAEKSVWLAAFYNVTFLLSLSICIFIFAPSVIALFTSDAQVIESGILCLRIICAGYIFFAYGMVVSQAFNGAGDTATPTWMNFICFWVLETPLAYLFAVVLDWGPSGVYWSIAISESALAFIAVYLFRKGRWKQTSI